MQRIYIDTSVVGGYFDEEFSSDTIPFFDRVTSGEVRIIVSDLLEAELLGAPDFVKELSRSIPAEQIEKIRLSSSSAGAYQKSSPWSCLPTDHFRECEFFLFLNNAR